MSAVRERYGRLDRLQWGDEYAIALLVHAGVISELDVAKSADISLVEVREWVTARVNDATQSALTTGILPAHFDFKEFSTSQLRLAKSALAIKLDDAKRVAEDSEKSRDQISDLLQVASAVLSAKINTDANGQKSEGAK